MVRPARTICVLTACLLASTVLVGCNSTKPFSGMTWFPARKSETSAQYASAKKQLDNPEDVFLSYARWKEDVNSLAEAKRAYEDVLADSPDSTEAMLGLARVSQLSGRTKDAERRFREAYEQHPGDPKIMHALGQFYASENRWDEAIAMLKSAALAGPNQPVYQYHLGETLARAGQFDEAIPHFAESVGTAEGYYNVGFILAEQGKSLQAAEYLEEAISRKPSLTLAHQLLAEVRTESEKTMLASRASSAPAAPAADRPVIVPASRAAAVPEKTAQRPAVPVQQASTQRVLTAQSTSTPQGGTRMNAAPAVQRREVVSGDATSQWRRSSAQTTGSGRVPASTAQLSRTTGDSGGQSLAGHGGLTPQQLEQLRNQTDASTARY